MSQSLLVFEHFTPYFHSDLTDVFLDEPFVSKV